MTDTAPKHAAADDTGDDGSPPARGFGNLTRGVCQKCGVAVPGNRFYCDEHRPLHEKKSRKDSQPKPRRRRSGDAGGSSSSSSSSSSRAGLKQLEVDIRSTYELMGDFWSMRDPFCGAVISAEADAIAKRWVLAAENDPRVRDFLERFSSGAGIAGIVLAHAPIVIAIMSHHVQPALARRRGESGQVRLPGEDSTDPEKDAFRAQWEALTDEQRVLVLTNADAAGEGEALREALGLVGAAPPF